MSARGQSQVRLLVVDDEPAIRMLLDEYFTERDYAVTTVAGRQEAEEHLSDSLYDVMVTDLGLCLTRPDGGLRLVAWARGRQPQLWIVVLSGSADPVLEQACIDEGADAFVHKPLPLAELERFFTPRR